ncbi:hypothetical protein GXP67_00910 [Rhodocytophaga rosea]|uniref:Uncharacterized protein n=1 Tax=Rhodocytophaga rosea TaxID=2704465 RepID=A0A6C0GBY4_9BACT|nr:FAD-dependent oxidoreductase [Rhodocytophaga rosea]QHT65333.1 hypothetical protein GXP67_00910 [Rhodocytophaga rosea]
MDHQKIAYNLINNVFKLKSEDFPMGDKDKNIIYLRGQRFNESLFGRTGFITNYNLNEAFQGKHPDDLFTFIVNNVLVDNKLDAGPKDRQTWDKIKENLTYHRGPDKGEKLSNMGFWNLIKDQIGNEGYNYLSDASAYYSNTINWNAAEAMPYIIGDFVGDVKYNTIEGGFDRIAEELAKAFIVEGGEIFIESQLINFRHNKDDKYPYRYILEIRNTTDNIEHFVYCNDIILAMPRRSLELINQDNCLFENGENVELLHNLRSVLGEPSFKLLMAFTAEPNQKPWWYNELGITHGRSITDLPIRQCYYFGSDPYTHASLMLASYNDMRTVDFWKPLEISDPSKANYKSSVNSESGLERFTPKSTSFVSKKDLEIASKKYKQAPERMVAHTLDQLREMHGLKFIEEPFTTMYENWNDDPYGGGYHAWKARYDVGKVMKYMRRPKQDENIYICGEAYSDQQGWIEGALCVAEKMMQDEFNMSKPSEWLDDNYYLGR